jgi:CAAX prenyl protease-like protein
MEQQRLEGHGWWPYLGPYAGFLIAVQVSSWLPDAWAPWLLVAKPAVPALLIAYFAFQGRYPELGAMRLRPGWLSLDILLGIALAALWMAPYLWIEALPRPDAEDGFDPHMAGASAAGLILGLRLIGYALVTPLFEELFIRSFVMRVADVYNRTGDFRKLPIARYTQRSFITTVVVFTAGHAPWEWWVAVPWVIATNLWFYLRKDMSSVIAVHASTNASILIYVTLVTGGVPGGPLWVFV